MKSAHSVLMLAIAGLFFQPAIVDAGNGSPGPAGAKSNGAAIYLDSDCRHPGSRSSGPVDEPPGQAFKSCRRGGENQSYASSPSIAATPLALVGGCPVSEHDIVVDNIADLRVAAGSAAPGSVIGIDGMLDINSDFLDDVIVTVEGVTVTCASDDAGLSGFAATAVLWVQADNVTVKHLAIEALVERGVVFGDHYDTGTISADGGEALANSVNCARTCIGFMGVDGGLARNNDVTAGFKFFGIVASGGRNVTVEENSVSDCIMCVRMAQHTDGLVAQNTVERCDWDCILSDDSTGITITGNQVSDTFDFGIEVAGGSDNTVSGNQVSRCSGSCIVSLESFRDSSSAVNTQVSDNTLFECATTPIGTCVGGRSNEGLAILDNDIHQNAVTPYPEDPDFQLTPPAIVLLSNVQTKVRSNAIEGGSVLAQNEEDLLLHDNLLLDCDPVFSSTNCISISGNSARITDNRIIRTAEQPWGTAINMFAVGEDAVQITGNIINGPFHGGIDVFGFGYGLSNSSGGEISTNSIDIAGEAYWSSNGITINSVDRLLVERNRVSFSNDVPGTVGLWLQGQVSSYTTAFKDSGEVLFEFMDFAPASGNLLANNRASGAEIGLWVDSACDNTFLGNNLKHNQFPAVFSLESIDGGEYPDWETGDIIEYTQTGGGTGGNVFAGGGPVYEEPKFGEGTQNGDGYLDCDGDGNSDPNAYSGQGGNRGALGHVIGPVLSAARSN